jgi:sterol desaturase/sphingolipid hydroxylase (fatty acid hydroxylase superfamily)
MTHLLHVLLGLAFAYVLVSFSEYVVHRFILHRMKYARLLGSRYLERLCRTHSGVHHRRDYLHDRHEGDDRVRDLSLTGLPIPILGVILVWPISSTISLTMFFFAMVYGLTWWVVHDEMHEKRGRAFTRTAVYRYIEWKHYLHHRYPGSNFNLILPLWDTLLGTATSREQQALVRKEMSFT